MDDTNHKELIGLDAPEMKEYIEIKDGSFSYSEDRKKGVKDISLRIEKGEHVALKGKTGSGIKTR